ncbi:MAG: hypothetical protein M1823_002260 [Watsoniomyces obsoletus]|nr:MAG: hypothetical protein M1823_002260 [Watsoniomyces obsoletus]
MAALVQLIPPSTTTAAVQRLKQFRVPGWLRQDKKTPIFNRLMILFLEAWKSDVSPLYELGVTYGEWDAVRWIVQKLTEDATCDATSPNRLGIGMVLRSLGTMIQQAAEHPESAKKIMPHVLHILASLHQINALPPNMYQHAPPAEDATIRSPPTLHLLSSRILASMSDAVWTAHEKVIAESVEGTPNRTTHRGLIPPVRITGVDLPPEVWMEFVLWACVKGGYPLDGSIIVCRLVGRTAGQSEWSTCSSEELIRATVPTHDGMYGSRNAPGRPKTISAEVVKALIDDLVEQIASATPHRGDLKPSHLLLHITLLKSLLLQGGGRLERNWWKGIISRLMDALTPGLGLHPHVFGRLLRLASESQLTDQDAIAKHGLRDDVPASVQAVSVILDHIYWKMYLAAEAGHIMAVNWQLKAARFINDRGEAEEVMPGEANTDEVAGDTNGSGVSTGAARRSQFLSPTGIRNRAAAAYLDLIVQTDMNAIDRGWLFSDMVAGAGIPRDRSVAPELIPALLRFAGFIKDRKWMTQLERHKLAQSELSSPTNNGIIRASLEGHTFLREWDRVTELLEVVKWREDISWDARLVMTLAKKILGFRNTEARSDVDRTEDIERASELLQGLLQGNYGPPETERLQSVEEQERYQDALRQMISQASEHFIWLRRDPYEYSPDVRECAMVPVAAFHTLLKGVIKGYGSSAGRQLWDKWCEEPSLTPSSDPVESTFHVDPSVSIKSPWIQRTEHLTKHEGESTTTEEVASTAQSVSVEETSTPSSPLPFITIPLVKPNIATVRMISLAAENEYRRILKWEQPGDDGVFHHPKYQPDDLIQQEKNVQKKAQVKETLEWAVRKYRALGLTDEDHEIRFIGKLLKMYILPTWTSDTVYVRPLERFKKKVWSKKIEQVA